MKWLRNLLNAPLRGRVHRMSVTKGGEVSIVVRFGMEEMRARQLNHGVLLDIVPHTAGKVADAIHKQRPVRRVMTPPEWFDKPEFRHLREGKDVADTIDETHL